MRSPSDRARRAPHGRGRLSGVAVVGFVLVAPLLLGTVRVSGQLILPEGHRVTEDLYAFAERVVIEGVIEGDLIVVAGELVIDGLVEGDVLGLVGGSVRIAGTVQGSVRVAAVSVGVSGSVVDDVASVAAETRMRGAVGRDVLSVSGEVSIGGSVGRDVRGQAFRMTVDGPVDGSVVVRTDDLALGPAARVRGDVVFESGAEARVSEGAVVSGALVRRQALTPVWTQAVSRLLGVLSLFGFVVAGLVAQWALRGTSQRAVETARARPARAALIGLAILLVPPILALPLFLTLVGIPVALAVLVLWAIALFLGPLPSVTAAGERMLRGRGGIAAGLVIGALALRGAMWLLPLLAAFLYLGFLLVGLGSYGMAAWGLRREHA